jgi:hypothetical protein
LAGRKSADRPPIPRPRRGTAVASVGDVRVTGLLAFAAIAVGTSVPVPGVARAAQRSQAASAAVLSDHHLEGLDAMPPAAQAELLIERAINRYRGAAEEIVRRAAGWTGKIAASDRLENLFRIAINSDDMRVRSAAIEMNLAKRNLFKDPSSIDRLEGAARTGAQGPRANALWDIALLGNRGIEPYRAYEIVMASIDDPNVNIRYWAVEGLAYLGTDAVLEPLLAVLHDDPSAMIRERAACGLAQSGMLDAQQRRLAIPRLLEFTQDYSLDAQTRGWVFQALRDITGASLPPDASAWKAWYERSQRR